MLVFLDTETGGIGLDKSLLTAFFLVTDDQFNPKGELYLRLKPDDGVYRVTAEAMRINRINLITHDQVAITYDSGGKSLWGFLNEHSQKGKIKIVAVGHNVSFDLQHIFDKLVKRPTWENFVSYRLLDTQSTAQYLILKGKLDGTKTTGSLKSLGELFAISPQELGYGEDTHHDARYDSLLTRAVLQHLSKL